jgi:hypothetical protein
MVWCDQAKRGRRVRVQIIDTKTTVQMREEDAGNDKKKKKKKTKKKKKKRREAKSEDEYRFGGVSGVDCDFSTSSFAGKE